MRAFIPLALLAIGLSAIPATGGAAETLLDRGAYLVRGIAACGNCHTPQGPDGPDMSRELAGGPPIEIPGAFVAVAPNLTPDTETGLGGWTDAEIATAIREGKRPDGSLIGPPMPFQLYRSISDRDVAAIVAYLRSLPAVRNDSPASTYHIPLPPAYGPPVGSVPEPDRGDPVVYGAYLAGPLGHCIECHSGPTAAGLPDIENQLGAGGFEMPGPWGLSVAANITPANLGDWSDAEIERAITQGVRPDGTRLKPPMPFGHYANIRNEDLAAIVAYLRTLPPK